MAMKKCKECGNKISTKAQSCPSCGAILKKKTSGCTGCLALCIIAVVVCAIVSSLNNSSTNSQSISPKTKVQPRQTKYPYNFIKTKTEKSGPLGKSLYNRMDLYEAKEDIKSSQLINFCKSKKNDWNDDKGIFYIITFFDNKSNAAFPKNPFTALFALEEDKNKHIKAFYEFNRLNGYSKLTIYETNAWESKGEEIDIK